MNVPGFTTEALAEVEQMLFAESSNPYEGKCGQKKLREQNKTQRTQAQLEGDKKRAQALSGRPRGGDRSAAAAKAAETRKRCKGGSSTPTTPTTTV
jgi:hypothetical protein